MAQRSAFIDLALRRCDDEALADLFRAKLVAAGFESEAECKHLSSGDLTGMGCTPEQAQAIAAAVTQALASGRGGSTCVKIRSRT